MKKQNRHTNELLHGGNFDKDEINIDVVLVVLKDTALKFHYVASHPGYFHHCADVLCKDNKRIINQIDQLISIQNIGGGNEFIARCLELLNLEASELDAELR